MPPDGSSLARSSANPADSPALRPEDMLLVTADHGRDPTIKTSTDHTREYVPLLVYGKNLAQGIDLGTRKTFADIACTLSKVYELHHTFPGRSFYSEIKPSRN